MNLINTIAKLLRDSMKHIKAIILILISLLFVSCHITNTIPNNTQPTE